MGQSWRRKGLVFFKGYLKTVRKHNLLIDDIKKDQTKQFCNC